MLTRSGIKPARPAPALLEQALRSLAVAAAAVATYCDHSEHGQPVSRDAVLKAAATLRLNALVLAKSAGKDLLDLYARRLTRIERESVLSRPPGFDPIEAITAARSWADLQRIQEQHDRHFHPDVFGLPRIGQLRHCALHAAKFPGALAMLCDQRGSWRQFLDTRLPDMLLFGLKLSTIMGERLPPRRIRRA